MTDLVRPRATAVPAMPHPPFENVAHYTLHHYCIKTQNPQDQRQRSIRSKIRSIEHLTFNINRIKGAFDI